MGSLRPLPALLYLCPCCRCVVAQRRGSWSFMWVKKRQDRAKRAGHAFVDAHVSLLSPRFTSHEFTQARQWTEAYFPRQGRAVRGIQAAECDAWLMNRESIAPRSLSVSCRDIYSLLIPCTYLMWRSCSGWWRFGEENQAFRSLSEMSISALYSRVDTAVFVYRFRIGFSSELIHVSHDAQVLKTKEKGGCCESLQHELIISCSFYVYSIDRVYLSLHSHQVCLC